jgi:membrane-bound ClpP family serine protease
MVEFFGVTMSSYTIIMIVFLIFLVIVVVLGDIGDFFDVGGDVDTDVDMGLSPVSLPVVGVFGTAFGAYGTILESLALGALLTPILAVLMAAFTAGGVWLLMLNIFVKTQAETKVNLAEVVGYKGQVIIPIKPGQPGQVVVITDARGRTLLQAISEEAIGTDEHVMVDSVVGNSVKVHRV